MCQIGFSASLYLADETETSRLGVRLAPLLAPGDVLLLEGPIGAGKTHLARAIIQHMLDIPEDVPSPTYTLVQAYHGRDITIWHADLYRLSDASEVIELGLTEAFETSVVLIEWPDRLGDDGPDDALWLKLASEAEGRRLHLTSQEARWKKLLPALQDE